MTKRLQKLVMATMTKFGLLSNEQPAHAWPLLQARLPTVRQPQLLLLLLSKQNCLPEPDVPHQTQPGLPM